MEIKVPPSKREKNLKSMTRHVTTYTKKSILGLVIFNLAVRGRSRSEEGQKIFKACLWGVEKMVNFNRGGRKIVFIV